jgi:uncharacterized membrane protein
MALVRVYSTARLRCAAQRSRVLFERRGLGSVRPTWDSSCAQMRDMVQTTRHEELETPVLGPAEIGALAHLYRGEVYRSTMWRTRLDHTTNWAVVTLGIAFSVAFSRNDASPLPLVLVGILIFAFLGLEARRYRYFNVWRARTRWMETNFYAPMLRGEDISTRQNWQEVLAADYCEPMYHISYMRAIGRRLRRNYAWIFAIQAIAFYGKIAIHPTPLATWEHLWERTAVGPIPGGLMVFCGILFYGALILVGVITLYLDRTKHKGRRAGVAMG